MLFIRLRASNIIRVIFQGFPCNQNRGEEQLPAPRRPITRFSIRSETPMVEKCNASLIHKLSRTPMFDDSFPSAGHVANQTFSLPDVPEVEDLRPLANLRYQARSLLARNEDKMDRHPLLCPREWQPVMASESVTGHRAARWHINRRFPCHI